MRDRGITRPGLKAAIAAGLALAGATAMVWGAWTLQEPAEQPSIARVARNIGFVVLLVGVLAAANYLYAHALMRKLRRGDGIIARWTVPPATFAQFREIERGRKKRRNNWRMPRKDWSGGLPVIFGPDAVLVGDSWFRLSSKGLTRFTYVRIERDRVPSVEFSMTLTVPAAGATVQRTARYRGHLRVPIAENAGVEAARVVAHFQTMLAR